MKKKISFLLFRISTIQKKLFGTFIRIKSDGTESGDISQVYDTSI